MKQKEVKKENKFVFNTGLGSHSKLSIRNHVFNRNSNLPESLL